MTQEIKFLTFRVEGAFITEQARMFFYEQHDMKKAVDLLMDCLVTDKLSKDERFLLALRILNHDAELVGTYPGDDYGLQIINEDSDFTRIFEAFANTKETTFEEKYNDLLSKYQFVLDEADFSEYRMEAMNREYQAIYDKPLFPNLQTPYESETNPMLSSYLARMLDDTDDDYGWLAPDGTFYPVPWGEHSKWAQEYLEEHFPYTDNQNLYHDTTSDGSNRFLHDKDVLIYKLHWILLDNPAQGQAIIVRDPAWKLTTKQKDFLFDYLTKRNRHSEANQLYQETD